MWTVEQFLDLYDVRDEDGNLIAKDLPKGRAFLIAKAPKMRETLRDMVPFLKEMTVFLDGELGMWADEMLKSATFILAELDGDE